MKQNKVAMYFQFCETLRKTKQGLQNKPSNLGKGWRAFWLITYAAIFRSEFFKLPHAKTEAHVRSNRHKLAITICDLFVKTLT